MSSLTVNTQGLIGDLIPHVYIDNVILESSGDVIKETNPHIQLEEQRSQTSDGEESFLSVKVDLLLKDLIENNIISSWLEQKDFHEFLKVVVIAVTNENISNIILNTANARPEIIFGGGRSSFGTKARIVRYVAPRLVGISPAAALSVCEKNIHIRSFGFNGFRNQVEIQDNSNGDRVRNINIRAIFKNIKNLNPYHLDIIAFSYIDINRLAERIGNVDFSNSSSLKYATGRLTSQSVIRKGSIVRNATIFRQPDGAIWPGPVHRMENGSWMSGESHNDNGPSIYLERVILPNVTVQDFRNVANLEKNIQDLTLFESVTYPAFDKIFQERVKKNLTVAQTSSYLSDLFLSRAADNSATLFFSFNFDKFVKDNTRFPHMLTNKPSLLSDNFEILELKVVRRRVKKPAKFKNSEVGFEVDSKDVEIFDKQEIENVIIRASQSGGSIPPIRGRIFGNSIREVNASQNNGIRSFSIKDKSISSATDGFFQYGVEIQIKDSLISYLRGKISQLSEARKNLNDYFITASTPNGVKKDLTERHGNPHISPSPNDRMRFAKVKGNYNPHTNRFTQAFIASMDRKYQGREEEKPWIQTISLMSECLYILTSGAESTEDIMGTRWARDMWTLCSPQTGSPDGIQTVLKLVDNVITRLSSMIGVQQSSVTDDSTGATKRNSLDGGSSSASGAQVKKDVYEFKYYFNNSIFDSNTMKDTGYHFIPRADQGVSQLTSDTFLGVTTLTANQFRDRHNQEVLKYFNRLTPQIPTYDNEFGYIDPELIYGLADVQPSSYGFLSTTIVTTSEQSFTLDGNSSEDNLAILASNIMNLKSPPNEPMRSLAPPEGGERGWNEITTLKNRIIRDNLIDVLADKNCTVETPASPASLSDEALSQFTTRLQRDNALELSGLRTNLRDYLGNSSNATNQLREDLGRIIDIHTRRDGDVFNPGPIFLKLMMNFALENETLFRDANTNSSETLRENTDINIFDLRNTSNVIEQYKTRRLAQRGITVPLRYSSFIPQLPLQIKSLFLSSLYGGTITREIVSGVNGENMFSDRNILKDPLKMLSFFLKYMSLAEIEVLTGYGTTTQAVLSPIPLARGARTLFARQNTTNRTDTQMKSPQWQRLTQDIFNNYVNAGVEMFCRLKPYKNQSLKISAIKGLQLPIFDQFFMIKPAPGFATVDQAPLSARAREAEQEIFEQRAEEIGLRAESELGNRQQIGNDLIILERTMRGMSREFLSSDRRLLDSASDFVTTDQAVENQVEVENNVQGQSLQTRQVGTRTTSTRTSRASTPRGGSGY